MLSPVEIVKVEMLKSKMEELQAYLSGASKKLGYTCKIGNVFTHVEIPGRNASGGSWEMFKFIDENPDLPFIAKNVPLLADAQHSPAFVNPRST